MPLQRTLESSGGRCPPPDTLCSGQTSDPSPVREQNYECRRNFSSLSLILLLCSTWSTAVVASPKTHAGQQPHPQYHHHIHSRKFHQETSFAVVETSRARIFDVSQELRETLTNLNQLRFVEEQTSLKNVTAQIGHHVYMHCMIESLGDKTVSWLRLRDFHLLTIGLFTYTSDDRFVVRHGSLQPNDWALQIKHVTPVDEGIYECQVNSDPPRSQYYRLNVKVPQTRMVGSPDMFVRAGSPLNLTCVISNSPELPAFVFWYHNERMINYDYESREKGSISLKKDTTSVDTVISHLFIRSTKVNDSGNYSCHFVGSSVEPAHIYVHVLQGERRQSDQLQNDENQRSGGVSAATRHQPYNHMIVLHIIFFVFVKSIVRMGTT